MTALQGAVESTAPVSRLHEHQSFSLDDFPVPSGREEEWRFTPLRKLRGLHSSPAAGGKVTILDANPLSHGEANKRIGAPGDQIMTPPIERFTTDCLG